MELLKADSLNQTVDSLKALTSAATRPVVDKRVAA
jgi:hypothetical protein